MKLFILVTILLFIYALYVSYPIFRAFKESAKLQASTVAYEQHPAGFTMKILVAGDSTAVGTGSKDPKDSTAGRLGQDNPTADISNIGEYGLKLSKMKEKLNALPENKYNLIVLQIGANDIVGRTAYMNIESELVLVLDRAAKLGDKVVVITSGNIGLSPVFKFPLSTYLSYRTRRVHEIFRKEISKRENISFVELYKDRRDDVFVKDIQRYYAADLFHPTGDAYALWYKGIKEI